MTKQARCMRCKEWGRLATDSKYCTTCIALLGDAYRYIDETAEKAKAQAYHFWITGGANFTQCTNHVTAARSETRNGSECLTHLPAQSSQL